MVYVTEDVNGEPLIIDGKPVIDVRKTTLREWLALIYTNSDKVFFADWEFPTDEHRDEYISTIHERTEHEFRVLLRRFLIPSGSLGVDKHTIMVLSVVLKSDEPEIREWGKGLFSLEFYRRLIAGQAWEGITWVLDLLPYWPLFG